MPEFVLNVSKGGKHYCRITLRETFAAQAAAQAKEIAKMFGPEFICSLTEWTSVGKNIKI